MKYSIFVATDSIPKHAKILGSPYLKHQLKGCKDKTVAKKNRKEADKIMKEIDAHHSSSRRLSPWNASMLPLANTSDTGLPGPPPGPAGPSSYPNIIPIAHPTGGSSSDSGLSGGKKNKGKK